MSTSAARHNAARRAYHVAVRRNAERLLARDVFEELSGDALDPAAALSAQARERLESPRFAIADAISNCERFRTASAISDRERFARALKQYHDAARGFAIQDCERFARALKHC